MSDANGLEFCSNKIKGSDRDAILPSTNAINCYYVVCKADGGWYPERGPISHLNHIGHRIML